MILNVYKEANWTSFDVVAKIRGILRARRGIKKVKVGHAGTLDPLAEGVLVVLTDMDTKKQDRILNEDKEYLAKIAIGAKTPSYDLETELTFYEVLAVEKVKSQIDSVLSKYIGEIEQVIPAYSAKKIDGKKLYELARSNKISLEDLPTKQVTIHSIEVESVQEENIKGRNLPVVICKVVCSKGTYIRALANDIGRDLGSAGVLVNLIRTRVGDFAVEDSVKIADLKF